MPTDLTPPTNEQLAALSDAATQGVYDARADRTIGAKGTPLLRMYAGRNEAANAAFIVALVNAYRAGHLAGHLAVIGPDAVEAGARVRRYLAEYAKMSGQDKETIHALQVGSSREAALHVADLAALTALTGRG